MSDYNAELYAELYAEMCHDNGIQYDNDNVADEMLVDLFEFA